MPKSYDVVASLNRIMQSQETREATRLDAALKRLAVAQQHDVGVAQAEMRVELSELGFAHKEYMFEKEAQFSEQERAWLANQAISKEGRALVSAKELAEFEHGLDLVTLGERKEYDLDIMLLQTALDAKEKNIDETIKVLGINAIANEAALDDAGGMVGSWFSSEYATHVEDPNDFSEMLVSDYGFTVPHSALTTSAVFAYNTSGDSEALLKLVKMMQQEIANPESEKILTNSIQNFGMTKFGEADFQQTLGITLSTIEVGFKTREALGMEYRELAQGDFVLQHLGEVESNYDKRVQGIIGKYSDVDWVPGDPGWLPGQDPLSLFASDYVGTTVSVTNTKTGYIENIPEAAAQQIIEQSEGMFKLTGTIEEEVTEEPFTKESVVKEPVKTELTVKEFAEEVGKAQEAIVEQQKDVEELRVTHMYRSSDFWDQTRIAGWSDKVWRGMMEEYGTDEDRGWKHSQGRSSYRMGHMITEDQMQYVEKEVVAFVRKLARRPESWTQMDVSDIPGFIEGYLSYRKAWESYMIKQGVSIEERTQLGKELEEILKTQNIKI